MIKIAERKGGSIATENVYSSKRNTMLMEYARAQAALNVRPPSSVQFTFRDLFTFVQRLNN